MGLLERFMAKVSPEPMSGCWLWTGCLQGQGYGQINVGGKIVLAHRLSYELHRGPIAPGLYARHTCDFPACVNPDHIQPGTPSENSQDKVRRGRDFNLNKTACPRGHPYSPENTHINKNRRFCKACNYLAVRRYQRAKYGR